MKVENIRKEGFHFLPFLFNGGLAFMFWIFWFKKPFKKTWRTPLIALSWVKGLEVWILIFKIKWVYSFRKKQWSKCVGKGAI